MLSVDFTAPHSVRFPYLSINFSLLEVLSKFGFTVIKVAYKSQNIQGKLLRYLKKISEIVEAKLSSSFLQNVFKGYLKIIRDFLPAKIFKCGFIL